MRRVSRCVARLPARSPRKQGLPISDQSREAPARVRTNGGGNAVPRRRCSLTGRGRGIGDRAPFRPGPHPRAEGRRLGTFRRPRSGRMQRAETETDRGRPDHPGDWADRGSHLQGGVRRDLAPLPPDRWGWSRTLQVNSIQLIIDASGADGEHATYQPFGEACDIAAGTIPAETKGFVGERYDASPELQFLNARYYDPQLSLFTSPDWLDIEKPGVGTNRYAYAGNSPVNNYDPDGNLFNNTAFSRGWDSIFGGGSWDNTTVGRLETRDLDQIARGAVAGGTAGFVVGTAAGAGAGCVATACGGSVATGLAGGDLGSVIGSWAGAVLGFGFDVAEEAWRDRQQEQNAVYSVSEDPKAPGQPTSDNTGGKYAPPKKWDGEKVKTSDGEKGYPDNKGNVWVPTGPGSAAHGGPHWDVQLKGGGYTNVYLGGKERPTGSRKPYFGEDE